MSESLDDRLARIGAEAEAGEEDQTVRPLPAHVKVSRPNRSRSKVLQVRLTPAEFDALEAVAAACDQPVSTVARDQLLKLVEVKASAGSVAEAVSQLMVYAKALHDAVEKEPGIGELPVSTLTMS